MDELNDLQSMIIISCVSCVENWENKIDCEQTAIINFLIGFIIGVQKQNGFKKCGFDLNKKSFIVYFENEIKTFCLNDLLQIIDENCFT